METAQGKELNSTTNLYELESRVDRSLVHTLQAGRVTRQMLVGVYLPSKHSGKSIPQDTGGDFFLIGGLALIFAPVVAHLYYLRYTL